MTLGLGLDSMDKLFVQILNIFLKQNCRGVSHITNFKEMVSYPRFELWVGVPQLVAFATPTMNPLNTNLKHCKVGKAKAYLKMDRNFDLIRPSVLLLFVSLHYLCYYVYKSILIMCITMYMYIV